MTTVIAQKAHKIEILVNTIHVYNLYGLPIIGIPIHELGSFHDYRCMKHRITSVYKFILVCFLLTKLG